MLATDHRIDDPLRLFERDPEVWATELAADLTATWASPLSPGHHADWMSRPSILRRVAKALGEGIGGGTDRIVCAGAGAEVLGAAVSLATGIPFVAIMESTVKFGAVHAGEKIAVVSVWPPDEAALDDFARRNTIAIESVQEVIAGAEQSSGGRTLFTTDDRGRIVVYGRTHRSA